VKLSSFMESAYPEKRSSSRLKKSKKDVIFSLEDLADRIGERPDRASVEELVGEDESQIELLLSSQPNKRCAMIWAISPAWQRRGAHCRCIYRPWTTPAWSWRGEASFWKKRGAM